MMKNNNINRIVLGALCSLGLMQAANAAPSVDYRVAWDETAERYRVYMKPISVPDPNYNMTAQVTIKAPYQAEGNKFTVSDFASNVSGANWLVSGSVHAPTEDVAASYLSFSVNFTSPGAYAWQADQELEAFSFKNSGACLGVVNLITADDDFNYPNSVGTNPGNQFTNLGWGDLSENHYRENYGGGADCRTSDTGDNDDDFDGLTNAQENALGTNPNNPDSDGDGVPDGVEVGDVNAALNTDGDDDINALDVDDDNDGVWTKYETEEGIRPDNFNTDGDSLPDYLDTDDDGDGLDSALEGNDPNNDGKPTDALDLNGNSIPDYLEPLDLDADSDNDGLKDVDEDLLGTDPTNPDSDGDGVPDGVEVGDPLNPTNTDGDDDINALDMDDDGDGLTTVYEDTDGDGDPTNDDSDGDGTPNYLDTVDDNENRDSDNDGLTDAQENLLGTNVNDPDSDGDGIPDNVEVGNVNAPLNTDGDDKINALDPDDDGDGISTANEDANNDGDPTNDDSDNDGTPDYLDTVDNNTAQDSDNDGLTDAQENLLGTNVNNPDSDGDGVPDGVEVGNFNSPNNTDNDSQINALDTDDDGDGILTANEDANNDGDPTNDDSDNDGTPDYLDTVDNNASQDSDNDGLTDAQEDLLGTDKYNVDSDNDGVPDNVEVGDPQNPTNTDGDDKINAVDADDDDDGILSKDEDGNGDNDITNDDEDDDGIPDYLDALDNSDSGDPDPVDGTDSDNDGLPDSLESNSTDRDGDGVADRNDYDPTGYFYCENTGKILAGGHVSVSGGSVNMINDGSSGYYQFMTDNPGSYSIYISPPNGTQISPYRAASSSALNVGSNITVLGAGERNSMGYLTDWSANTNSPWYTHFTISTDSGYVINNNIPLVGGVCDEQVINTEPQTVPTMGEWARILLTLGLGLLGLAAWRRNEK
jgi:heat shock protein beta